MKENTTKQPKIVSIVMVFKQTKSTILKTKIPCKKELNPCRLPGCEWLDGFLCPRSLPIGFKCGFSSGGGNCCCTGCTTGCGGGGGGGEVEWFDDGDSEGVRECPPLKDSCDEACEREAGKNRSIGVPSKILLGEVATVVTTRSPPACCSFEPGCSFHIIGLRWVATCDSKLFSVEWRVAATEFETAVDDRALVGEVRARKGLLLPIGLGNELRSAVEPLVLVEEEKMVVLIVVMILWMLLISLESRRVTSTDCDETRTDVVVIVCLCAVANGVCDTPFCLPTMPPSFFQETPFVLLTSFVILLIREGVDI